jgi:hypothetical protein
MPQPTQSLGSEARGTLRGGPIGPTSRLTKSTYALPRHDAYAATLYFPETTPLGLGLFSWVGGSELKFYRSLAFPV